MIPNVRGPICKCKAISGWIGKDACQCHGTGCLARGIEMTGNQTFIQICHFFLERISHSLLSVLIGGNMSVYIFFCFLL